MARRRYRRRHGLGEPSRSGVGFVVFGGLAVAAGAVFLIARSANAATPPGGLTPAQIKEMQLHPEARSGAGHFKTVAEAERYAATGPGHF